MVDQLVELQGGESPTITIAPTLPVQFASYLMGSVSGLLHLFDRLDDPLLSGVRQGLDTVSILTMSIAVRRVTWLHKRLAPNRPDVQSFVPHAVGAVRFEQLGPLCIGALFGRIVDRDILTGTVEHRPATCRLFVHRWDLPVVYTDFTGSFARRKSMNHGLIRSRWTDQPCSANCLRMTNRTDPCSLTGMRPRNRMAT